MQPYLGSRGVGGAWEPEIAKNYGSWTGWGLLGIHPQPKGKELQGGRGFFVHGGEERVGWL